MGVFGYDDVANHAMMLVDRVRMSAFAAAIEQGVKPGDVVVDVGSGSGILALLCAKAGARRVYALERGPMVEIVREAARDNGLDSVIEVIRGDARDIKLPLAPNVLVSEMIGSFGIDEDYRGLLGTVRKHCAQSCRVIPGSVETHVAVAELPALDREVGMIRGQLGVTMNGLADRLLSRVSLARVPGDAIAGSSCSARFDVDGPPPAMVSGVSRATRAARVNALVGWFESDLVEGVRLSSSPAAASTHWAHLVFPLAQPLSVSPGDDVHVEVRTRLLTDRGTWKWSARSGAERSEGNAMKSLVGDRDDWLRQLDIVVPGKGSAPAALARWAAALGGDAGDVPTMARRLRSAYPDRYLDDGDAEQDVLRMIASAERAS